MRRLWTVLIGVGVAAGGVGISSPASADLAVSCTGTASDVTVPFDLFVPAGRSCELTNVVITGDATVRAGANLFLTDSSVTGNLVVQPDAFASLIRARVDGATRLNSAFGTYAEASTLGGNVTATSAGFLYALGSSLRGVTSTGGETLLQSARLSRGLTTTGGLLTDVYDSVIEGAVSVSGAAAGSVVCLSEMDGDASFTGSGGVPEAVLQIGAGCGFNVFGGNLVLSGNTAPSQVVDNVIRGGLDCTGNDPAPVVSNNRVRGPATGQCAAAAAAGATAAPGDIGARAAGILARVRARTAGVG